MSYMRSNTGVVSEGEIFFFSDMEIVVILQQTSCRPGNAGFEICRLFITLANAETLLSI